MKIIRSQDRQRILTPAKAPPPSPNASPGFDGRADGILHPIHLYASTTLAPLAADGVNAMALKNPKGQPMELLEIKFLLQELGPTQFDLAGGSITCKLALGKMKVTNDYIPLAAFGSAFQLVDEFLLGTTALSNVFGMFSWRLPRPLYIPSGAALVPSFQHTGQSKNSITVHVGYSGRALKGPLDESRPFPVPYAASYLSKLFAVDAADTDSSKETDLVNSTPSDLHISRMAGRLTNTASGVTVEANSEDELFQVDMIDSRGYPWVPQPTAFRQVFSAVTRSWEMPIEPILPPGHYVIANITKNAPTSNIPTANTQFDQACVSMIGWREVSGSEALTTP